MHSLRRVSHGGGVTDAEIAGSVNDQDRASVHGGSVLRPLDKKATSREVDPMYRGFFLFDSRKLEYPAT